MAPRTLLALGPRFARQAITNNSGRSLAATANQSRYFSKTGYTSEKSAIDTAKDTLKKVDRSVSDAAVSGIEKGRKSLRANIACMLLLHSIPQLSSPCV